MLNNAINAFLIFAKNRFAKCSQNQSVVFWHAICNIQGKTERKGGNKMNTSISRKTTYIGAGAGIVLFAIFGLLPGSLLGGAAGIKLAGMFFGLPLDPGIISRAIVLASMLVGVIVSGITIVTATSTMGWLVGRVLEGGHASEKASMAGSK